MREITKDVNLIASCGLYCGACGKYLSEKCPGCSKNDKASWCKVRTCCKENSYLSCANCEKLSSAEDCKKLNNFISKIFALLFNSNRNMCIKKIKDSGNEKYADEMSSNKIMSLKKK